ncbi:protein FAM83H [Notolabrus celidotus]|uniref:protein FAM83H n=1 Tax=Notolabrus celidotus TaxID=1203425 RepID=UPI00148F7A90|nr:protein FAM83H [Notolabrus celidotus]XP_034538593.1 protein FAM83H [Notolabrus celidotus]
MARRSQCSSAGDNPLDPNYLPPHYREEYRLGVDALVEEDLDGYYQFLQKADVVDFLSSAEIEYIQGSVRLPQHRDQPEHCYQEGGDDGSSDTYWPLHSDLDAPGLDLGWPQIHHFIGPTEVTTLVNPPETNMPSIKEQARRLIKNAHQVIAIAMDMFTDVDIFADVVGAAMRNVAVYILLDKENVHHFVNMVTNCRVDLQNLQFLRVRTVSGITYHCRSGKSFKGQMMDRFLLTDCRAVLSGNYSFMWSYEKLHRCMAHLFLGQLVSTFDEEFRILFAQSEPLVLDNVNPPMDDFNPLQKRKPLLYREPRKFLSLDTPHPDDWAKRSHDDRTDLDWRMAPLKRQEAPYGSGDVYGRSRMDPSFDQSASRKQMMENPAFKRHSYAEGGHGRYSYPFMQPQGAPEPESQGHPFHRGQQPYPGPGRDADYGHDRFCGQDFRSSDQYSDPGLPPDLDTHENFDPVLNFLSSTRNFDQGSEKIPPGVDSPFGSQPRRQSLGQPYVCQTSPTPSNQSDQKHFLLETNPDRKDPTVKRGLRKWRISSFLSAHDNPDDDGLPSTPPNAPDPFEDQSNPIQQTAPGPDVRVAKIPNVREFKIPAMPRASQMQSYTKTSAREPPKKPAEDPTPEPKSTRSPSESSSTTEGEKMEEAEPKEPKALQREESFRRKYNATVQRTSRLRSSLIFSSLDQQNPAQDPKTAPGQQDEDGDKTESEQKKVPYMSQMFGQRRTTPREPIEWSRYVKSSLDSAATDSTKADQEDSEKDKPSKDPSDKGAEAKTDQPVPPTQPEQQPQPFPSDPLQVDMNDPDMRLMFFKEMAAKRRAAKAAEAEKNKDKVAANSQTVKEEGDVPKDTSETTTDTSTPHPSSGKKAAAEDAGKKEATESPKCVSQGLDPQDQTHLKKPQSSEDKGSQVPTDSEQNKLKSSQSGASLHASAGTASPEGEAPEEPALSSPAETQRSPTHPPTPTRAAPFRALSTEVPKSPHLDSTSQDPRPLSLSVETPSPSNSTQTTRSDSLSAHTLPGSSLTPSNAASAVSSPHDQSDAKTNSEEPSNVAQSGASFSRRPETLHISPPLSDPCLPHVPDPKSKSSPSSSPADPPKTSPSQTPESPDSSNQVTPPSELPLTPLHPAETGSGSPPETETVLSPEADQTQTPSDHSSTTDPNKTTTLPSEETLTLTEPETDPSDSPVPAENTHTDPHTEVSTESELPEGDKVSSNGDQTTEKTDEPPSPQSKKSAQSRYHSSTANVLSSSNLRDDTKLLLEQISANSQNRNEATKEPAVTDDEKEDEADKNAKRDKDRGIRLGRAPPKSDEERDKLLERIQSMRKERRVYSRFEMAP